MALTSTEMKDFTKVLTETGGVHYAVGYYESLIQSLSYNPSTVEEAVRSHIESVREKVLITMLKKEHV